MSDNAARFTDRVTDYARYRPTYPDALFGDLDRFWSKESSVADIGAGTGIFTRLVAPRVARVHALEPNEAMRAQGQDGSQAFLNIEWSPGTGESTGLPDASLDALVCAQAFHWLDARRAAVEWRRILKPSAACVLVWNEREVEGSALQTEYELLLNRWCPEYPRVNHMNLKRDDIEAFFRPQPVTLLIHRNDQRFDLEGWRGRLRSSSYCPRPDQSGHDEMMEGLAILFSRYRESDGLMTFPYVTKAYVGRLN